MTNIFKYGIMLTAITFAGVAGAKEDNSFKIKKENVFVTAGVQTEAFMNNEGHIMAAMKVGGGIWLKPWLGLKLEGLAGNTKLKTDSRGQVFGVQLSYMAKILEKENNFGLNAMVSTAYLHHRFGNILKKYSYMNMLTANLGVQGVYNFSPRWNVYLEPSLILQPKYYDVDNKDKIAPGFMLTAGVNFAFAGKKAKAAAKVVKEKKVNISYRELESMNEEINELRQKLEEKNKENENKEVIIMPKDKYHTIDVKFDVMGAVLNASEIQKLKDVATWIKDHNNAVTVVAFADYSENAEQAKIVKQNRFNAIYRLLTEEFGVDKAKVIKGDDEKMGYNKNDNQAFILFMDK